MALNSGPYAALLLKEVFDQPAGKGELLLPLALSYLLSAHIRFYFPMPAEASRLIDAAFDEVLNGFYLESKGILYAKGCDFEQATGMLEGADLLITTDERAEARSREKQLPCVFIVKGKDGRLLAKLRYHERIEDGQLRQQVAGCAQLINILSGNLISKGHFSLSW